MVKQGEILWIDLNPSKGTKIKKKRPCVVISNNNYNYFFNTALVLPISSAEKYKKEKYTKSPFFESVNLTQVHGTILLQHLQAVNITVRSNEKVIDKLSEQQVNAITDRLKMFF